MKLQSLPNGETVAHITLYGNNRPTGVLMWHQRVMVDHWGIPINYVQCPFPGVSHGAMMNEILRNIVDRPDAPTYIWWWDMDCIALRREVFGHVIDTVKNKRTVWGQAWSSMHKVKARGGSHPYASQACLCFSHELYLVLGRPDCDHHDPRADTAELLTYAAEEKGYTVALQYPSQSDEPYTVDLSQSCRYGRSIVYGPGLTYHETRADLDGHAERFVATAQKVIAGGFEV